MNWEIIGVLLGTIFMWYAIFTIGFFHALFWVVMGGVLGAIYFNYKENK